jgi:hypothetical protein
MQKARIRTGWKNRQRHISVAEFANALSAICWRISLNAAKNLHQQDFQYDNDEQRVGVIREYLHFMIHCADRLVHGELDDAERETFVVALSRDCLRHYAQNSLEILGRSEPAGEQIEQLNATMGAMSRFRFENEEPGFEMYRLLGSRIQELLGQSQINKWVIDQVMDIDGPTAYELFRKSFDKLKRSSGY